MSSEKFSQTPFVLYKNKIEDGYLERDDKQLCAIKALDRLFKRFSTIQKDNNKSSLLSKLFSVLSISKNKSNKVKGLYMYGGVGRGKTMLMDLFYERLEFDNKKRVHFHQFMSEIHAKAGKLRKTIKDDVIEVIAYEIVKDIKLLCFDELHVNDIADAMIIGRLFKILWQEGVVVVATSNIQPDNLYLNGLNRDLFLSFIDILKENVEVVDLGNGTDYRLLWFESSNTYYSKIDDKYNEFEEEHWRQLTAHDDGVMEIILVNNRKVTVPKVRGGVAWFSFDDICRKAYGADDYLEFAFNYNVIFISKVPIMHSEDVNAARRFINLIDILYDHRVKIIITAEGEPEDLCNIKVLSQEFQRTFSRLEEMMSKNYLSQSHI